MVRRADRERAHHHPRHRHREIRRRRSFWTRHATCEPDHVEGDERDHRQGQAVAALLLQSKPEAIEFAGGRFVVSGGTGHRQSSTSSRSRMRCCAGPTCRTNCGGRSPRPATRWCRRRAIPFGSHVCEVEIDPDLGTLEIIKYSAVDDVGRAVNPMIIHGQTHGGIVQGVGQALLEQCFYDARTGQLLSASFMDYAMPRADVFPFFDTGISEVPTRPIRSASAGRRRRHHAALAVVDQRHRGCVARVRRAPRGDAGHPRAHLARHAWHADASPHPRTDLRIPMPMTLRAAPRRRSPARCAWRACVCGCPTRSTW